MKNLLILSVGDDAVTATKYLYSAIDSIVTYLPSAIGAILILWLGFKIANKILTFVDNLLGRSNLSTTLRPFIMSVLGAVLKVAIILAAAGVAGVDLSIFATIIGASVLAIGLSLQGSLGNLASGLLVLTIKPFKVGDWIKVQSNFGKVMEIGIFNTTIVTPGNKTLIIPNSLMSSDVIVNYSERDVIRLEIKVAMPYSESYPKVKSLIETVLTETIHILEDPKPEVGIVDFDTHSVQLIVRPYVHPDNYWEAIFACHKNIKNVFHQNNIQVAYSEDMKLGSIGE